MEKDLRPWGRMPRSHIWHPPARRAGGPSARPWPSTRGLGPHACSADAPHVGPCRGQAAGPEATLHRAHGAPRGPPGRRRALAIVAGSWHSRCRGAPRQHLRAAVSHTLANACGGAPGGIRTHDPRFRNTVFLAAGAEWTGLDWGGQSGLGRGLERGRRGQEWTQRVEKGSLKWPTRVAMGRGAAGMALAPVHHGTRTPCPTPTQHRRFPCLPRRASSPAS